MEFLETRPGDVRSPSWKVSRDLVMVRCLHKAKGQRSAPGSRGIKENVSPVTFIRMTSAPHSM